MVAFDWHQVLTNSAVPPKLPREEVEKYLERNGRSAASLLTAYRTLQDTNYLREAATNPLANYLSARDYLKSGQSGLAVSELLEAAGKPAFKDYAMDFKLDEEELNMAAGRSSLQARLSSSGWAQDLLPQLASLKALAQDVAALQKEYVGAGDNSSAENLAQAGLMLANGLRSGDADKFVIKQLVGNAIEAIMLSPLDPNGSYDFLGGKSPSDRLAELKQQRVSLRTLTQVTQDALPNLTEAELLSYTERQRLYGELEAMRWLQQRRTPPNLPEGPR